ncbi:topoisomerase DNA-binding C4 zinc finger domain-containing protein [Nitratireductor aquimarinus]|uniref:Topoisomerase DNA-binding C4 zinc finger domain-containing protein n=1 Tax=Nitratireductor aquimarinus TaxID=889300 RepID=A0ABU4AJ23_9HYPH|nr:topoisomerase DNA-binding C4 zinc finger domain-containing protein [Nitratireductor aquimarinus]MDV6226261.1 topoisomerase DNA-binding C4 zinc finger domain-containing protein [Nitratireductor aquimarinus]
MQEIVIGKDRFLVAELIGKGGEGEVYAIKGRAGQAVKIYNSGLRAEREDKVRAMVGEGLAVKTDLVAYPGEVVTDHRGNFLGFVMRLILGYRPLHELYSPKSRQRHFPKADYRFTVHAALNVARAVGKVHQTGCVIGDLNHSGVLVAQDATVALIDADSFQFNLNGKSYPCVVGVPDFTPPELHGKNLASVHRTIEHDNFGLAVAIFHLLFKGRHPYAGRYKGPDISMGDAIAQNRFAFSLARKAATQTSPPPGALTLDMFPDVVSRAFESAFGLTPSARPSALDWIHALNALEGSLNHCSKIKTHYYPGTAGGCVWCKLTASSGFDMFPDLTAVEPNIPTDARGTEQAIREILAFRFPTVADLLPAAAKPRGASSALREARSGKRGRALMGLLMMGGAVAGFIFAAPAWFVWIGLAIWGGITLSDREVDARPFQQAFKDADERVQRELDAFVQRNGMTEVVKVRGDLDAAIDAYKGHDDALTREIMVMKSSRESRQRQAYLDRFSIRRANISGIGPAKTATLISFGIETAADVTRSAVLRVPGFGDVTTGKLVAWRRGHEVRFRYDRTPNAQDVADERALRGRFAADRAKLESAIRNGLGTLRNAKSRLNALLTKAKSDRALTDALAARAQAEQDLIELGVSVPASTVALTVTPPPRPAPQPPRTPRVNTPAQPRVTATSANPTCSRCGAPMVRRTARRGRNAGGQFWGCSRYPHCKGTRNI